jgi:large subunit ribosomal protein L39e
MIFSNLEFFAINEIHLKRGSIASTFMAARKSSGRKIRLLKKKKQNSPVPAWIILKTKRHVRTNPQRRQWRRTDVEVG